MGEVDDSGLSPSPKSPLLQTKVDALSPVLDFLEGKNCLTGVSICWDWMQIKSLYETSHYFFKLLLFWIGMFFIYRELGGGNMNFAMVVTYVNFMWTKPAKLLWCLAISTRTRTKNGSKRIHKNVQKKSAHVLKSRISIKAVHIAMKLARSVRRKSNWNAWKIQRQCRKCLYF